MKENVGMAHFHFHEKIKNRKNFLGVIFSSQKQSSSNYWKSIVHIMGVTEPFVMSITVVYILGVQRVRLDWGVG